MKTAVLNTSKWTLLAGTLILTAPALADGWATVRSFDGVAVEARGTASAFREHRGETAVCTSLTELAGFVGDTSRFREWIPYTKSARLLDESEAGYVYYVRSATPWPMKDRDMVYRITRHELQENGLQLIVTGLPDYRPHEQGAERIRTAEGEWLLLPGAENIRVSYRLYVDPGSAPAYLANRRLAAVVGQTLGNLARQFPCAPVSLSGTG